MKFIDCSKTLCELAPLSYNAEFYYEVGLKVLNDHKSRLELHSLWKNYSVHAQDTMEVDDATISSMENIIQVRELFRHAWKLAPPSSANLTKKILRCLALVLGPETSETASLLHLSVGGSARNVFLDRLSDQVNCETQVRQFFDAFERSGSDDTNAATAKMFSDTNNLIPSTWIVSVVAICPTGELMISSLQSNGSQQRFHDVTTVCVFPGGATKSQHDDIHSDLLLPLDTVIERSRKQLSGMSEETQHVEYNEESMRRKWWQERHRIDDDLESLVQLAEQKYFGHRRVCARLVPVGDVECCSGGFSSFDDSSSECSDLAGNLEPRFDEAEHDCVHSPKLSETFDDEVERENLKKLTVPVIKSRLCEIGYEGRLSKMRKAELIDLLLSILKDRHSRNSVRQGQDEMIQRSPSRHSMMSSSDECDPTTCCNQYCTVLILDEHLQRFPFESMPMFDKKAVTRVPSLPFLLASLHELKSRGLSQDLPRVHPDKVKCVIDPESNLTESASNLSPALDAIAKTNGCTWESVIGVNPSQDFMEKSISEQDGLLLYCGHGGGERLISRKKIEDMTVVSHSHDFPQFQRGCKSAIILMGCSSGKLQSVNTPQENPCGSEYEILYEPEGIALSYIVAGAPCVVGNLWDVTDRDIDRYATTMLSTIHFFFTI